MTNRFPSHSLRLLACGLFFAALAAAEPAAAQSRRMVHQQPVYQQPASMHPAVHQTATPEASPQSPQAAASSPTFEGPDNQTPAIAVSRRQATNNAAPLPPTYVGNHAPPLETGWNVEYCGPACDAEGMPCFDGYCGPNVYWGRMEFLLWWTKGMDLPPLVSNGVLPGGDVLFGDDIINDERRPGGRGTLGIWMDDCHTWGVGVKVFALGSATSSFDSQNANQATVGRPFLELINPQQAQEQILIINGLSPQLGQVTGNVVADTDADLFGGEIFIRHELHRTAYRRIDFLIGYQGTQIEEELTISHTADQVQGNASFTATDRFRAVSEFHGGELGVVLEYMTDSWFFEGIAKMGLGNMHQQVSISGESQINGAAGNGGFLALESNSGVFGKNDFSIVPEINFNLGYFATDRLLITMGYSFLHWNNVVQVGDHIDRVINPALLPGPGQIPGADPQRPRFRFNESDYYAHGLSFGLQFLF